MCLCFIIRNFVFQFCPKKKKKNLCAPVQTFKRKISCDKYFCIQQNFKRPVPVPRQNRRNSKIRRYKRVSVKQIGTLCLCSSFPQQVCSRANVDLVSWKL